MVMIPFQPTKLLHATPIPQETESTASEETDGYIGNINSKKFHLPSCYTLPAEKNKVYLNTRDEAIEKGYDPCTNCQP